MAQQPAQLRPLLPYLPAPLTPERSRPDAPLVPVTPLSEQKTSTPPYDEYLVLTQDSEAAEGYGPPLSDMPIDLSPQPDPGTRRHSRIPAPQLQPQPLHLPEADDQGVTGLSQASSILVPHGGEPILMEGISLIGVQPQNHDQEQQQNGEDNAQLTHEIHERGGDVETPVRTPVYDRSSVPNKRRRSASSSLSAPPSVERTLGSSVKVGLNGRGLSLPASRNTERSNNTSKTYVLTPSLKQPIVNPDPGHDNDGDINSDAADEKAKKESESETRVEKKINESGNLTSARQIATRPMRPPTAIPRDQLDTIDPKDLAPPGHAGEGAITRGSGDDQSGLHVPAKAKEPPRSKSPHINTRADSNIHADNVKPTIGEAPADDAAQVPEAAEPGPVVIRTLAQAKEAIETLEKRIKDVELDRDWAWGAMVWTNRIADISILSCNPRAVTACLGRLCGRYLSDPVSPIFPSQIQYGFPPRPGVVQTLITELCMAVGSRSPDFANLATDPLMDLVFFRAIRTLMTPYDAQTPLRYLERPEGQDQTNFFAPPDVLWLLVHTGNPVLFKPLLNAIRTTLWACSDTQRGVALLILYGRLQGGEMRMGQNNKRWAREQGERLELNNWRLPTGSAFEAANKAGYSWLYRVDQGEVQGALDYLAAQEKQERAKKTTSSSWVVPDRKGKAKEEGIVKSKGATGFGKKKGKKRAREE